MGGYPEESIQEEMDRAYSGNTLSPRKDSEIENLLSNLEKELEVLTMSANGFVQSVNEVLAPERDDEKSMAEDQAPPSSPLGHRLLQSIYRVRLVREKLNDANGRVRV